MSVFVVFEVAQSSELLGAPVALVRLLTCMKSAVDGQSSFVGKFLSTFLDPTYKCFEMLVARLKVLVHAGLP